MKKKLAIIGQGTAGSFALTHYLRWTDWDIDWYYDENTPSQAVGEGANLVFPRALFQNINFQHTDLEKLDGSFKLGIEKTGWAGQDFIHTFPAPSVSYHFNAKKFQSYIRDITSSESRLNIINKNINNHDDVDADFIMDCSGKPKNTSDFIVPDAIPVNSVHVTQCYWEGIRFQQTLTIARPYGWVFGIPLKNRCSIGYLYNNNINTLEEVKEDVKQVFKDYNLTPSQDTNTFTFGNYYRKQNFVNDRIAYNGNASFFLEPLEATSISTMDYIQRIAYHYFTKTGDFNYEYEYRKFIKQVETMISLHYYVGSRFNSKFWDFAKEKAEIHLDNAAKDIEFQNMIRQSQNYKSGDSNDLTYGTWHPVSFHQNLNAFGMMENIVQRFCTDENLKSAQSKIIDSKNMYYLE